MNNLLSGRLCTGSQVEAVIPSASFPVYSEPTPPTPNKKKEKKKRRDVLYEIGCPISFLP